MLSLILFRFSGRIAEVKLKSGVVKFFLIFVCTLLTYGCDSKPPKPMPYQTTPDEDITVINSNYSVSRFWTCGWDGDCPRKRWNYCVRVTPKNERAALNWYRRYYRDELLSAGLERESQRGRKSSTNSSSAESMQTTDSMQNSSISNSESNADIWRIRREHFVKQINLIESGDLELRHRIFLDMQAGIYFTAWYRISKAGEPDESHTGWNLSPHCYPKIPEDKYADNPTL